MLKSILAAAFAVLAITPAWAKCEPGSADAKALAVDASTPDGAQDLTSMIVIGTQQLAYLVGGGSAPFQINDQPNQPACAVATISLGPMHAMLYADDAYVWPRRAHGGGAEAFLLATLDQADAHKFMYALTKNSRDAALLTLGFVHPKDVVFMLATHVGADWTIFGFYDRVPDTPRLAQAMCQAMLGSLPPIATYKDSDQSVTLKMTGEQAALDDVGRNGGPCAVSGPPQ